MEVPQQVRGKQGRCGREAEAKRKEVGGETVCQGERDLKVCLVLMVFQPQFSGFLIINPLFLRRPGLSSLFKKKKTHRSRKRAMNSLGYCLR